MQASISSGIIPENVVYLGFDIGSVSLNTAVTDACNNILEDFYDYVHGKPFHVLRERLSFILGKYSGKTIKGIALTGSGGRLAAKLIGGIFINEIIAQVSSTSELYPEVKTVIEIGGEDSKLILLDKDADNGQSVLAD
ncbi:MAG TPA: hypothetical protein VJ963_07760, partial [Bacteroidales bacterium]|nr:hypothetical protein [Bacteroidales bacterium]